MPIMLYARSAPRRMVRVWLFWQTAKWWHEYSAAVLSDEDAQTSDAKTKKRGGKPDASKVISGAWCVHHELP